MNRFFFQIPLFARTAFLLVMLTPAASCDDRIPDRNAAEQKPGTEGVVLKTFEALHAPVTRTVLDADGTMTWAAGDQVNVFDNVRGTAQKASYVVNNTVSAEVEAGADRFFSVYPYDPEAELDKSAGILYTAVPVRQNAGRDGLDSRANVSVAATDAASGVFRFSSVGTMLKFSVADENVVSVKLETLDGEMIAGGIAVDCKEAGPLCTVRDGAGSRSVILAGNGENGTFEPGAAYFVIAVPQQIRKGIKVSCLKDNGAVGVFLRLEPFQMQGNTVCDLGEVHCASYHSPYDQFERYKNDGSIEIAGKTYLFTEMPGTMIREDVPLRDLVSGNDKRGIYFLNTGIDFDLSGMVISSEVVLVGNFSNVRSKAAFGTNAQVVLEGGTLTLANLDLMKGARTGYWFGHPGGSTATAEAFVIDNCSIDNLDRPLWYVNKTAYAVRNISITRSRICVGPNGKNQMFNLWNSTALSGFESFVFRDNVLYAAAHEDIQLINGNSLNGKKVPDSKNTLENLDLSVEHNLFYNVTSMTSNPGLSGLVIRAWKVKSLNISRNIFASGAAGGTIPPRPFFTLNGPQPEPSITGFSKKEKGKPSEGTNYVWNLNGQGFTHATGTKVVYTAGPFYKSETDPEKNPFRKADATTGTFELTPAASGYGPREQ